ncbi:hypothetical protein BRADI_5g27417v3 [Brachypodium distachyon]|uniref:Uncharacterized protein n=1 Tax=Brachypodium distachyon TaxID=15368 RepID=A0A2K2CJM8_BRADI|nr:hypothetical protein BRADI_5g27417v3 [Brachypodium distachyon]
MWIRCPDSNPDERNTILFRLSGFDTGFADLAILHADERIQTRIVLWKLFAGACQRCIMDSLEEEEATGGVHMSVFICTTSCVLSSNFYRCNYTRTIQESGAMVYFVKGRG